MSLKIYALVCESLIDFNETFFIPYNEMQFWDWPNIVVQSPAGLLYIAQRLERDTGSWKHSGYNLNEQLHSVSSGLWVGKKSWLKCLFLTKIPTWTSCYRIFLFLLRFKWCRQKWICNSVYLFNASFLHKI